MKPIDACPVCGGTSFSFSPVLWGDLVRTWQLAPHEVAYIDQQQGLCCRSCGNNLRSMTLASAVCSALRFDKTLVELVSSRLAANLRVLEINTAGNLTPVFQTLPKHRLVEYPAFDMMNLALDNESFDLVIHSDTLEHVPDPVRGLAECWRVLSVGGRCIYTVPIVVERMTRSRTGLEKSYHGNALHMAQAMEVHTEFGADAWTHPLRAGFRSVAVHCLSYPAGLAIELTK